MVEERLTETAAKLVTGAWRLWNNRNEVCARGVKKEETVLMKRAVQYLAEYNAALDLDQHASSPELQAVSWTPPTTPIFKINVDGAVFSKQGALGLGVLVRDGLGRVIAALSKRVQAPMGVVEAEAKAFEAGMLFPIIYFEGRLAYYLSGSI